MAQTNRLTGSSLASFTPDATASAAGSLFHAAGALASSKIDLHKYLQRITDQRGPRVVVHEFPYRDGAKVEVMGRKPHKTTWDLIFVGEDWLTTLVALVKAIDGNPGGMLVHPIYGQMRVVCHGVDPSIVDLANATDTVSLTLTFTEDQVDLGIKEQQGAAAKQQAVSSSVTDFLNAAAAYLDPNTVAAVAALSSSATTFSASAFAAVSSVTPDPSLPSLLNSVATSAAAAEIALQSDSLALQSVAQVYDALAAAEIVYSNCLDLSDEVALETVGFQTLIVDGNTSIAVVAQANFGPRAISVIDQILRLNPHVLDPTNIEAGTELTLPL